MSGPGRSGVVGYCMVLFQAASRPGGPAARLFIEFVEAGHLTLSVSDAILAEVADVLGLSQGAVFSTPIRTPTTG